ncbi:MAG: hypothetical protein ACTS7I_00545 [Candidatus Hodgkinia cicadicola]
MASCPINGTGLIYWTYKIPPFTESVICNNGGDNFNLRSLIGRLIVKLTFNKLRW